PAKATVPATTIQPRLVSMRGGRPWARCESGGASAGRHGDGAEHVVEHFGGGDAAELGLGSECQTVLEDRDGEVLEVVGNDVVAAACGCLRAGGLLERERCAGRHAEGQVRVTT